MECFGEQVAVKGSAGVVGVVDGPFEFDADQAGGPVLKQMDATWASASARSVSPAVPGPEPATRVPTATPNGRPCADATLQSADPHRIGRGLDRSFI